MVPIVGLASGIGGRDERSRSGPLKIKEKCSLDGRWVAMIEPENHEVGDKYEAIARLNTTLGKKIYESLQKSPHVLSIGGDHSCGIGTWSGVATALAEKGEKLGLIWIDAHLDMHRPETSETGNIHGMPVAVLLGYGHSHLTNILTKGAKVQPENMVFIGIRSFEHPELALVEHLGIRVYYMEEVIERGIREVLSEVVQSFAKQKISYGISLDIDVLDPKLLPATGTPEENGIDPEVFLNAYDVVRKYPPLAFEFVEYNPEVDEKDISLPWIQRILSKVLSVWKN